MGVYAAERPITTTTAEPGAPPLPDVDPFYRPPRALAQYEPGALLRSRPVQVALFGLLPLRVTAWQLQFRSSDMHGRPEAAITTVLLPWQADPARPLISYQCAIDAVAPACLPSYAFRRGARAFGAIPQFELLLVANALARGWAVSVPDHVGSDGRFGAPREPGYRALDGIRAALTFLGRPPGTPVALCGYSGGGLATVWAAETAAAYAPELRIVAAAAGSPVGDLEATFFRLNGSRYGGLAALCLAGLRRGYPDLDSCLRDHLDAASLALLTRAETSTTVALVLRDSRSRLDDRDRAALAVVRTLPAVRAVLADIQPGAHPPAFPMLVVQAVRDSVISVRSIDRLVARYRTAGTPVRYLRDLVGGHVSLGALAAPLLADWVADRLEGRPLPPATTTTQLSVALSPRALRGYLRLGGVLLRILTGRPIRAPQG
ncbi:lipase family protein [Nocardia transvalensis]|uniref:lipase family protein n=1 Tax=Nocardia transvalensis TaxID=37333 RepID=UPI00189452CA|nr:lipase family protein [Nocardia transvalensis]MBF6331770.1 lipase [Nocardia transvalensis]